MCARYLFPSTQNTCISLVIFEMKSRRDILCIKTKTPQNLKIKRSFRTQSRDRTGMEVNPLVFETSASTNSAIWAIAVQK